MDDDSAATVHTGRFWLAGQPDEDRPGRLDLSGRWPRLELAEPLTPWLRQDSETTSPDGSVLRSWAPVDEGPEVEALTVHGRLAGVAGDVTLAGAYTLGRRGSEQQLEARHALLGGHEPGLHARFQRARVRVQHLDDWAQLEGFTLSLRPSAGGEWFDDSFAQVTYQRPTIPPAEVTGGLGVLRLAERVAVPDPTVRGAALTRQVWLELDSPDARTVEDFWSTFVGPVSTLLSLAVDVDCPPVALQVAHAGDGSWLDVYHPLLTSTEAGRAPRDQLLYREQLGLPELARWLAAPQLRPIPALVAGVRAGSERTVENQLLELATAAEGLHRRLSTDQRTFAQRLAHLLDLADPAQADGALGGLVGDRERWIRDITRSRNAFAHREETGQDLPDVRGWWDQRESLRWVLTAVLLLEAGVPAHALAGRLQQHQPYRYFRGAAHRQWPTPTDQDDVDT